jgi:hypothetical protein
MGGESAFLQFTPDTVSVTYNSGTNEVTITFQYTESGYTFFSGVLCTINGISVTVFSSTGLDGNGTVVIRVTTTTNQQFFTQGLTQVYQLSYTYDSTVFYSTSVTYYWRNVIDSNNINLAITGKAFSAIDISAQTKSILLPPVASKPGYIYRFKITNYASPFLLRISPYFSTFDGTTSLTAGTAPYDSSIDGALSTIRLQGQNYSIALVSDGTNWSIITLYVSSLLTPAVASVSGSSSTESTPTQILYHSTESIYNIIIAAMNYSFIKNICILNKEASATNFYIYFPPRKSVDNIAAGPGQRLRITLNIPANSLGTITLTYANSQYYILGYYIFGAGDNITNNTSAIEGNILTKVINFSNTNSVGTFELIPAISSTNYSIISILKLNNDPSSFASVTINQPRDQSSSYFAIANATNIKQLSISLTSNRYTCIWLAKYYNSTYGTIILPVHYYLATASGGGISP